VLQSLLDKSLLRRRDGTIGLRFWMLETIREFAAEQLVAAGEADDLKHRHLDHYAALARDAVDETLLGNDDVDLLEEERENLRVAFDLALEIEPGLALELGRRLMPTWTRRGDFREGRERLEAALVRAPHAPGLARARHYAPPPCSRASRAISRSPTASGTRHSLSSESSATRVEWAGR
jgi:non-specific serine/threonine protein kinase